MNGKTRIYQISPEQNSLMMCYIIRTANDRLIVIDGGIDGFGKENAPYLPTAIRAVMGLPEGAYFEVDAWFLSHVHTDHIYELAKMLETYDASSNYRINHLYFNFPPVKNGWESRSGDGDYSIAATQALVRGLDNYAAVTGQKAFAYDSVNGAVINPEAIAAGLTITVDDCAFDVLQTWAPADLNVNSTSTILRLRVGGKSLLFLGDAYIDTGDRLLATYGAEALRSDYVQLAHHGQSGCSKEFYLAIGTDKAIRLWPSPVWVWGVYHHPAIVCDKTRSWFGLPEKPEDYFAAGCDKTGRDLVSGLCQHYPAHPTELADWDQDVLDGMLVGEF